jgi:hypothetical protein
MLLGTSYREGEAAGFIEDQISQEHTAHIQMVSPEIHSTNDVSAAAGLREKYLKTGILI